MKRCCGEGCRVLEILLIFLNLRMCVGQLSCYFGKIDETQSSNQSLIQQKCTEELSTANSELHKSFRHAERKNTSSEQVRFCLVLMRQISQTLHSCDYDDICTDEGIHQQLQHEGQTGVALCCRHNLCNSLERAKKASSQSFNISCYVRSGESCDGFQCVNGTTFAPNGTIIRLEYGCENETDEEDGCKQMSVSEGHSVTCRCSGQHCNHPDGIHSDLVSTSTVLTLVAMTNPFYAQQKSERSMTFAATVVGISALLVFFLVLIGIGIKKFREHRTQHVTYTYTQLTADLAEERDTDDEYMLIG